MKIKMNPKFRSGVNLIGNNTLNRKKTGFQIFSEVFEDKKRILNHQSGRFKISSSRRI